MQSGAAVKVLHRVCTTIGPKSSLKPLRSALPVKPLAAAPTEVRGLRREARYLKDAIAEHALELRLLKKA
ncbi:hypothetical protein RUE5091_04186 [Ruegeria denitrificans]|uniref:Uncharacterized protein n=1 Tax=Ruegeria denitrificans TaxID=1715692 RepID=A0A0P1IJW7_9RHOB|nr:hypothetical protein RUE5091_04186 [Ruegeria denitrificans]